METLEKQTGYPQMDRLKFVLPTYQTRRNTVISVPSRLVEEIRTMLSSEKMEFTLTEKKEHHDSKPISFLLNLHLVISFSST